MGLFEQKFMVFDINLIACRKKYSPHTCYPLLTLDTSDIFDLLMTYSRSTWLNITPRMVRWNDTWSWNIMHARDTCKSINSNDLRVNKTRLTCDHGQKLWHQQYNDEKNIWCNVKWFFGLRNTKMRRFFSCFQTDVYLCLSFPGPEMQVSWSYKSRGSTQVSSNFAPAALII